MKNYVFIIFCLVGLYSLSGCEKDMEAYSGQDGLYFDVQYTNTPWFTNPEMWAHQIYTLVKFTTMPEGINETDLKLKVNVVGPVRDYDRPFDVMIVKDSTTAIPDVEYKNLSEHCVIKAGETNGYVTLKVMRTERMLNENVQIQIALLPNEYFSLPYTYIENLPGRYTENLLLYSTNRDPRIHNIFVTDIMMQPKYFSSYYFGEFSREKMELMLKVYPDATLADYEDSDKMSTIRMAVIAEKMANYLINQFKSGNPITDLDGTMMWFKGVKWEETAMPEDVVIE